MKIFNEPGWTPIYLNPTSEEITELGESKWDTVRILLFDDNQVHPELKDKKHIALASGYGHTHTSVMRAVKQHFKANRGIWTTPLILFFDFDKIAYFNCGDMSGPDKLRASRTFQKYLDEYEIDVLQRVIHARGLEIV